MSIKNLLLPFLIVFIFFQNNDLNGSIKIKYKIGDEIITNTDINNEKNYLVFLRPELKNLSNDEILKISQNSLIREIIKKKEYIIDKEKNVATTDQYTCKKCGESKCSVSQLQTRGADEPITTFITCCVCYDTVTLELEMD